MFLINSAFVGKIFLYLSKLLNLTDVFCKKSVSLYIFKGNIHVGIYIFKTGCRWDNKTLKITDVVGGEGEIEGEIR
jgi:hypothetical protein